MDRNTDTSIKLAFVSVTETVSLTKSVCRGPKAGRIRRATLGTWNTVIALYNISSRNIRSCHNELTSLPPLQMEQ